VHGAVGYSAGYKSFRFSGTVGFTTMRDGEDSKGMTQVCAFYRVGGCVGGGHSYTTDSKGKRHGKGTYYTADIGAGFGFSWSKWLLG